MNTKKYFSKVSVMAPLCLFISILAVGCGNSPPAPVASTTPPVTAPVVVNNPIIPQPIATTTPVNTNSGYTYSFQLQNSTISCNNSGTPTPAGVQVGNYTTPAISTDNIFRVVVTAGSTSTIPCTGYTGNYSCVQYTVTVGSRSQTVMLSYGNPTAGPCAGKPNSQTLDFSDQATVGHGPLTVQVSQPQSDNCRSNTYGFAMYGSQVVQYDQCSMAPLYANQIASGNLTVITNQ